MKQRHGYNALERAASHVFEGGQRVARQKEVIATLRQSGLPTQEAEAVLQSFERSLLEVQNHRVI